MLPFSYVGIDAEDLSLLQDRLYPQANKIFMETVAKQNNIERKVLPQLDYVNHPVYKMEKMLAKRQQKARYLKGKDTSEHDVKYLTYEEAVAKDTESRHVIMEESRHKVPLEELEKRFPLMKIKEDPVTLDDLSSDDEKAP